LGQTTERRQRRDGLWLRTGHESSDRLRVREAHGGHQQHGSPARRSVPHDGSDPVPCVTGAGNLTRATAVGTMRAVPALADDAIARIAAVRTEIAAAARRAGRDPAAVRIIAVVKTLPPPAVVAALDAGIEDVAENYVQEGIRKRAAVARRATWHLIGGLQRN